MEASDRTSALASLRARMLHVTGIDRWPGTSSIALLFENIGPVSNRSSVALFRSLAALIRAGVPLRRSIDVAIRQCADSRLKEALNSVLSDIEHGLPLSDGMSRRPKEFPKVFVALIRAGEIGGALDQVLERLASLLERDRTLRKRIASALAYPAVVACAAVALSVFLLASIVPMFSSMYEQMHVPLPLQTSLLIEAGNALRSPLAIAAGLSGSIGVAVLAAVRCTPSGSQLFEAVLFRLPAVGAIARKTLAGRFARVLGTLLRSGVHVVPALDVLVDAMTTQTFRDCIRRLSAELSSGSPISKPLAASNLFEPLFLQLVHVGEETGDLDAMLLRIADYYEVDVETALTTLSSLVEPVTIVILGTVVGFIVSAIFLPLYTLIGNIK
jgi:type IV pilus assembly protein PilC